MIPALTKEDFKVIGYYLGKVGNVIGVLLLVPIIVAIGFWEFDIIPHFLIASSITFIVSNILIYFSFTKMEMELKHALCVVAVLWIFMSMVAAVPFWSTGSTKSYLDASFDAMSGFTTTGLTLITDIDHLPQSINFYRHFLQFVGGIGIVVVALMVLAKSEAGTVLAFKGEARDLGIKPNIVRTSRIIFGIALTFTLLGATLLTTIALYEGMDLGVAIMDGLNYSMAAFGTGGFAPHSQSVLFYHSIFFEIVILILILIGSFNFTFHFALLKGNRREIFKNIEIKTIFISMMIFTFVTSAILLFSNLYLSPVNLFRKSFFHVASAHTATGFSTVPPAILAGIWPNIVILALTISMLIGCCANSTGGGIKTMRVGIMIKSFFLEVKRALLPKRAVVGGSFHHIDDNPLTDTIIKGAFIVAMGYVTLFVFGTIGTVLAGYDVVDSMYETSSALANCGLSSGITSPAMPDALKVLYIFLMWAGRLEIMAVLVLIGFVILALKKGIRK